jgi:hypothetical protein
MLDIKKQYVTNENNEAVAVQLDLETFEKMERLLEDYALGKMIEEEEASPHLSLEEAKAYYKDQRGE